MTQAVILCAGLGSRLMPLTKDKPKCLVTLLGKSLLDRQTETLKKLGIHDICVVGGYCIDVLRKTGGVCCENADYASTNMVASLFSAKDFVDDRRDLIIGYGDIVYETKNLEAVLKSNDEISIMVDLDWREYWNLRFDDPLSDAETLIMNEQGYIIRIGEKTDLYENIHAQYTGLFKVRADKVADLFKFYHTEDFSKAYMTDFIRVLINAGWQVKAVPVHHGWLEIDSVNDLRCYEALHAAGKLSQFYNLDDYS